MRCRVCNKLLSREDRLVDDAYCLDCIDLTDGDEGGTMHKVATSFRGEVRLTKNKGSPLYNIVHEFPDVRTGDTLRKTYKYDESEEDLAISKYLDLIREWL